MGGVGYLGALVLAAVFVWAAAAKLAHPGQTSAGLAALGVPAPGAAAWAVPAAELVTAALLVGWPPAGGLVALALLAGFSAVIARAVLRGVTSGCTCFGGTSSRPVSALDLGRNALLSALAIAAAATRAPARPPAWAVAAAAVAGALWFTVRRHR